MRKSKEINRAIALLKQKGDKLSLVQVDVLANRRNEVSVFERYVREVAEASRDESLYCAARDASLFLSGKIGLEELIPDCGQEKEADILPAFDTITLSIEEFTSLVRRVERLERRLGLRKEITGAKRKNIEEATASDLISQIEACKYVGCSKTTIKRWANNGFITGYQKGINVCYSRRELDHSAVVKEHRLNKKEGR